MIPIRVETKNLSSPLRIQNQIDIVRDISERLDAADIGYMLTGSMALNCYSLPCVPNNLETRFFRSCGFATRHTTTQASMGEL